MVRRRASDLPPLILRCTNVVTPRPRETKAGRARGHARHLPREIFRESCCACC